MVGGFKLVQQNSDAPVIVGGNSSRVRERPADGTEAVQPSGCSARLLVRVVSAPASSAHLLLIHALRRRCEREFRLDSPVCSVKMDVWR